MKQQRNEPGHDIQRAAFNGGNHEAANRFWRYLMTPICLAGMLSMSSAAELNPAAVTYKLPDQISVESG